MTPVNSYFGLADGISEPEGNIVHRVMRAVVHGGPGGIEHGMQTQRASERGRSRSLCEGWQYRRTSLVGEDVEKGVGKSDGPYYR